MFDKTIALPGLSNAQQASFENYMLSPEREKNLIRHPALMNAEDRSRDVSHADVENWKAKEGQQ
jgi:hypothetical protein